MLLTEIQLFFCKFVDKIERGSGNFVELFLVHHEHEKLLTAAVGM